MSYKPLRLPHLFYFFLILLLSIEGVASTLKPFQAQYNLYRGNSHVAEADYNLSFQNGLWTWTMNTRPTSFYRWLTRKEPFTQTQMMETSEGVQLLLQHQGDYALKLPEKSSWFDHSNHNIYYKKGAKVTKIEMVDRNNALIFDYHSIHLLYLQMLKNNLRQIKVNFYKRGRLVDSTLTLEKNVALKHQSTTLTVDRMTQEFGNSNRKMIYSYLPNSLPPYKIEQIRKGKPKTVMWRTSVE